MSDKFGLKDHGLFSKLRKRGVVHFPFLAPEKINKLIQYVDEQIPNWRNGFDHSFYLSILSNDPIFNRKLHNDIVSLIKPELDSAFLNYKCIVTLVLVKGKGDNSSVDFHQDLSICDESKYRSYTLWIPLTDSTLDNGAIRFLTYSHDIFRVIRSQTIAAPFDNVKSDLTHLMSFYPAKAGDALLWDQACIHQSPPNLTDEARLSLGLTLIGSETPMELYRYNDKNLDLEKYSIPDDFWFQYNDFVAEKKEVPKFGKRVGQQKGFAFRNLTKTDIYGRYLPKRLLRQLIP